MKRLTIKVGPYFIHNEKEYVHGIEQKMSSAFQYVSNIIISS